MDETAEFLSAIEPRLKDAEARLHNGDAGPRKSMWSRRDPLTLLGAAISGTGWTEIEPVFDRLGSSFSNCSSYEVDILAAEALGDLAYLVVLEHTTASIDGAPPRDYSLRVTWIFRREEGEWKTIHRHADPQPTENSDELVQQLRASSRS